MMDVWLLVKFLLTVGLALLVVSLLCSVMLSSTISRREERWWHGRRQ